MNTFPTFIVGGTLRDQLLGLEPKDRDFLVLAPSFEALREMIVASGAKIFSEKPEYLTIRCKHPTLGIADFTCGRKDGEYTDGRRPDTTEVTTDLVLDLARRDFTCNAMAQNVETGEIVDPFEGQRSIQNRVLSPVGNPNKRLQEDRLRAFRAARFAVTKKFGICGSIMQAIRHLGVPDFAATSTNRIQDELMKAFKANGRETCQLIFTDLPVLGEVMMARNIWLKPTTEQQ